MNRTPTILRTSVNPESSALDIAAFVLARAARSAADFGHTLGSVDIQAALDNTIDDLRLTEARQATVLLVLKGLGFTL